ncbi:SDR family oxidoreductase [Nocardia sp. NPDC050697]|uniref:SDR family oxidoreductase n=1 Tax=Nocardia sp. NPDC050697 TaxID=3155158 RepID=UPI0033F5458A
MGVYVVTGAASGMGRAAADKLRALGHTVVGVDLREAEVVADLGTGQGRRSAIEQVLAAAGDRLDGVVLAAGVGPAPGADRPRQIYEVNYRGVVELLDGWRPALAAAGEARVVVFGSNSTTTVPAVPGRAIRALLAGDVERALRAVRIFGRNAPAIAYAASKIAVTRWARRRAVTADWAGAGIRLNVLAPGAVLTPLLEKQLATPAEAAAIRGFPVPIGGFGDPDDLADWVLLMLSDSARFLCGSVVFVDGGSDAYFRPDVWPRAVPLRGLPGYLRRFRGFRAR